METDVRCRVYTLIFGYESHITLMFPKREETSMAETSYELYIMPGCPYCRRVTTWLDEHGINIPLKDITTDHDAEQTLIAVGGKRQVPCLFIDGVPLYESADIIEHLSKIFDC